MTTKNDQLSHSYRGYIGGRYLNPTLMEKFKASISETNKSTPIVISIPSFDPFKQNYNEGYQQGFGDLSNQVKESIKTTLFEDPYSENIKHEFTNKSFAEEFKKELEKSNISSIVDSTNNKILIIQNIPSVEENFLNKINTGNTAVWWTFFISCQYDGMDKILKDFNDSFKRFLEIDPFTKTFVYTNNNQKALSLIRNYASKDKYSSIISSGSITVNLV